MKLNTPLERRSTDSLMNLFGKGVELKDIDMKYVMTISYITCQTTLLSAANEGFDDSKMLTTILAITHSYGLVLNQLKTSNSTADKNEIARITDNIQHLKKFYLDIAAASLDDLEKGKILFVCQEYIIDIMKNIHRFGIVLVKSVSGVIE